MGYDLNNATGAHVRFTGSGWSLALEIAEHYGWQSAGIPKPKSWNEDVDGPWEDEYFMNAGQQITAEDAKALADALDRAVAAPGFVETVQRLVVGLNEAVAQDNPERRDDLKPISREQAEGFRRRLVELAGFAHKGTFRIE